MAAEELLRHFFRLSQELLRHVDVACTDMLETDILAI